MIQAFHLTRLFHDRVAVDRISFNVRPGEITGLLGPNGAGKTTTLRMLAGVIPASSGKVVIDQVDLFESPIQARRRIGYLPEVPALWEDLSATEGLLHVARLKGMGGQQAHDAVAKVIAGCGLSEVAGRPARTLSKGFRQRLALAQALAGDPAVLLLDEPSMGLDPNQISDMRALIREVARERTLLLSTHDLAEVVQLCARVIVLVRGRIVADATLEELTKSGVPLDRLFGQITRGT